jgi:flagellar biosynthesis protein FliR
MPRSSKIFLASIITFYVFSLIFTVIMADTNHLWIVRLYGEIIGILGIILGLCLIATLTSRPPFSTGEWRQYMPWSRHGR